MPRTFSSADGTPTSINLSKIIWSSVGVGLLLIIIAVLVVFKWQKRKKRKSNHPVDNQVSRDFSCFLFCFNFSAQQHAMLRLETSPFWISELWRCLTLSLILFRFARGGGRRISSPAKSSSITKYFQQIFWKIELRAAWNTWSHNTHSGGWKLFFLLRVQS